MAKYLPSQFEKKWVAEWEKKRVYKVHKVRKSIKSEKKKQYVLSMFPYPSGSGLHIGHVRIYTGTDVLARYLRMKGYALLHPMGWDAFGLPAENAAIAAKKNPLEMVPQNIANFKRQMKMLGFSYDWEREFSTTDPQYYKWTQWLFIQFFKMGLLYKKNTPINFCPSCKTGLAEEEVLSDGTHERCGNKITKKELPQWIFRITKYADKLLGDLAGLDWPAGILEMQRNWIGRSEGLLIDFKVQNSKFKVEVFTTRVDTLFGATALVVAPEHWLIQEILNIKGQTANIKIKEIKRYVEMAKRKSDLARTDLAKEKTGVDTGLKAIHPLTGEEVPILVADYVLGWYGGGAIMVVPAHDERDFEFAKKFDLAIKPVIKPQNLLDHDRKKNVKKTRIFTGYGTLINSGEFNGLASQEAMEKITEKLKKLNRGRKTVVYKLRDWIFSRQRYWGEPIPMIFCPECAKNQVQSSTLKQDPKAQEVGFGAGKFASGQEFKVQEETAGWFPVPENELPIKLPFVKSYQPTETGESPLAKIESFVKTKCPNCGGPAKRETDTMPNWAGSCWYYLYFASEEVQNQKLKVKSYPNVKNWRLKIENFAKQWLPVDWYLGGAEHAVLHLLYSRFWVKALQDLGLLHFSEPFLRLCNVGMVLAEDHRKMSKSLGNVINPDDVVAEYGADTLRVYEMFMAPFSSEIAWSTKALQGAYRFLSRVWQIYHHSANLTNNKNEEDKKLVAKLQKTILKVSNDITSVKFNTAIAAMMEFINDWQTVVEVQSSKLKVKSLLKQNAKQFLQLLAPFAPFITEQIWREVFGEKQSIHLSSWPKVEGKIAEEEIVIPVQVDGKLRATIKVQSSKFKVQSYLEKKALEDKKVKKYLAGKKYKVIYVEGKVINFALK